MQRSIQLLIVLATCVVSTRLSALATRQAAATQSSAQVTLPAAGFSFAAPEGWTRLTELKYSQLARFTLMRDGKGAGLIEVDATPARGRSAAELAAKVASDREGTVAGEVKGPAGEAMTLVLLPKQKTAALMFLARDQIVIISAGLDDTEGAADVAKRVAATFESTTPTAASSDLSLRRPPIRLFQSPVMLTLPEPYRPSAVKDPKVEAFWGARDVPSGNDEASVQMQVVENPSGAPLSLIVTNMARGLTEKLKLTTPMTFGVVNDNPETHLSEPFSTSPDESQRVAQVKLDNGRIAVLIFRTTAKDLGVRDRYDAMAADVARGLRVDEARPTTQPGQ